MPKLDEKKLVEDTKILSNIIDDRKFASGSQVAAVNRLMKLKKTKGPWDVIKEIVKIWSSERPAEYRSFVVGLKDTKSTRKVYKGKFTGVSKDKKSGAILRYTYDVPVKVVAMIRKMYPEMYMDKEFFKKMGRLFPDFKISKKV